MKVYERTLQSIGQSLLVSLPKEWTKLLKLKKGQKIKLIITEQDHILITPEFIQSQENTNTTITFNQNYKRHFFREYFNGHQQITIKLPEKASPQEIKELHNFLRKFITTQITEETQEKIIIKNFRIEELSIEECLKRMHFFTLNTFQELPSSERTENTLKFYYLLVMQIRRYLTEGKYSKNNNLSLIRILDIRMVAEKIIDIQRRNNTLQKNNHKINEHHQELKKHYEKTFNTFFQSKFENATITWNTTQYLQKKLQTHKEILEKKKEIKPLEDIIQLQEILKNIHEISMLIR